MRTWLELNKKYLLFEYLICICFVNNFDRLEMHNINVIIMLY